MGIHLLTKTELVQSLLTQKSEALKLGSTSRRLSFAFIVLHIHLDRLIGETQEFNVGIAIISRGQMKEIGRHVGVSLLSQFA